MLNYQSINKKKYYFCFLKKYKKKKREMMNHFHNLFMNAVLPLIEFEYHYERKMHNISIEVQQFCFFIK